MTKLQGNGKKGAYRELGSVQWFYPELAGQYVSLFFSSFQAVAVSLYVVSQTGGAALLGLLLAGQSVGRFAGTLLVRRILKRRSALDLLISSDVLGLAACLALIVTVAVSTDLNAAVFACVLFLSGISGGLYSPGLSILVRDGIPIRLQATANSLVSMGVQVISLLGAPAGIVFYHAFGISWCLAVNAGSTMVALGMAVYARRVFRPNDREQANAQEPTATVAQKEPGPGARLWVLVAGGFAATLCTQGLFSVALPAVAEAIGRQSSYGYWLVSFGFGCLLGARVAHSALRFSSARAIAIAYSSSSALQVVPLLLFPLVSWPVGCAALMLVGASNTFAGIMMATFLQAHLERDQFIWYATRVASSQALAIPISQLAVGSAISGVGYQATFTSASVAYGVVEILIAPALLGLVKHIPARLPKHVDRDPENEPSR